MKESAIKEIKKAVNYINGERVVEWEYLVKQDCATFSTLKEAKAHVLYLKNKHKQDWDKVTNAFMNDEIDYEIKKENDTCTAIVTDLKSNQTKIAVLEGTTPYQRRKALIQAFKELGL